MEEKKFSPKRHICADENYPDAPLEPLISEAELPVVPLLRTQDRKHTANCSGSSTSAKPDNGVTNSGKIENIISQPNLTISQSGVKVGFGK